MKVFKIAGFIIFKLAILTLYVFIVMQLWNWLMPMIFGIITLTFWQTLGVLLLCKLLFLGNGWGYRRGGPPRWARKRWKSRFQEKWEEKCQHHKKHHEQQNNEL